MVKFFFVSLTKFELRSSEKINLEFVKTTQVLPPSVIHDIFSSQHNNYLKNIERCGS